MVENYAEIFVDVRPRPGAKFLCSGLLYRELDLIIIFAAVWTAYGSGVPQVAAINDWRPLNHYPLLRLWILTAVWQILIEVRQDMSIRRNCSPGKRSHRCFFG